jgi:uncharacterized damage-inducible protein DinB
MKPERYLLAQAQNNAWADHRLLQACSALSQEELDAPRTGFFPSLAATLNHILVVDRFYVDALEGGGLGQDAFIDEVPCKTVAALRREQSAVDQRLVTFCAALDETALGRAVRLIRCDHDQIERTDRVLLHLFEHQIHHRGQAHCMLSGTPVAPPQLDEFFLAEEAPLRRDDLAALGWNESDLWHGWSAPR